MKILCWVTFLFLLLWGGVLVGQMLEEPPEIIISHAGEGNKLAAVQIFLLAGELPEVTVLQQGQTNRNGTFLLPADWRSAHYLLIQHPGFESITFPVSELNPGPNPFALAPQSYTMEEVVFSAGKFKESQKEVAQKIAVISAQDIRFRNPQTSADLLAQQGEVFVQKSQMGGGSPNLRGFEANKVLLVVDGVRMNNAIYRSGHLQNVLTVDPALVERTEVLFGPGSVIYGSDALGGVIHLYTRKPTLSNGSGTASEVNFTTRYGSANQEKHFHADVNVGNQRWGSLTSVSVTDFGDLRTGKNWMGTPVESWLKDSLIRRVGEQDEIIPNEDPYVFLPTAYRQIDLGQKLLFVPGEHIRHELNVQFSTSTDIPRYDRLSQTQEGRLRFAEWNYGPQTRFLSAYTLSLQQPTSWYDEFKLVGAYQYIQESRHNRSFQSDWRSHRMEQLNIFSLNLDATKRLGRRHQVGYGAEGFWNGVQSTAETEHLLTGQLLSLDTRYPDGGSQYQSVAAYLTHKWKLSERWQLSQGLRWSVVQLQSQFVDTSFYRFPFTSIQQSSSALSGQLSGVYRHPNGWQFRTQLVNGFRAPNLDDVAKVFDSQPGNVVVPNPDLKPEMVYSFEAGLKKNWGGRLEMGLTGFGTFYDNAIVVRPLTVNGQDSILYEGVLSQVQANVNAQQAYFAGFHQSIQVLWPHWKLFHTVSWTYGQAIDGDGSDSSVPMDHVPPLFGRGGVQFHQDAWRIEGNLVYQAQKPIERFSPRDLNNLFWATPEGSPGWWTLNLKAEYQWTNRFMLQAGVENLFDRHYRAYSSRISAAGRNLYLAVRMQF
ncbi:MAG: TonB-dependent receptor [Bacteroidota bacterium]